MITTVIKDIIAYTSIPPDFTFENLLLEITVSIGKHIYFFFFPISYCTCLISKDYPEKIGLWAFKKKRMKKKIGRRRLQKEKRYPHKNLAFFFLFI